MTDTDISIQTGIGRVASNAFGEHYLFAINRTLFSDTDAGTVFRSYFGESLFEEDTFYVIAGTDSGLLYQYVKKHGIPKGSRYLFVELPQILALLESEDDPEKNLAFATDDNWTVLAEEMEWKKFAFLGRLKQVQSLGVIHGHYSHYQPFWIKLKEQFDGFLQKTRFSVGTRPFIFCQINNLTENQIPAVCLKDSFKGKTVVILAGGPSLDGLFPWIHKHRDNLLLIAASRISHSLIRENIRPDICVSVDPQAFNLYVCRDMLEFQDDALLINHYHLSPGLLSSWSGKKVFIGNRYPWSTPLQPENILLTGGITVTNTMLDIATATGAAQIVLGGVDFCFAQQGYTHARGTVEHAMGSRPQLCEVQVETNGGMMADTDIGYRESGIHIDLQTQVANKLGARVINPAASAMRLPHVEHIPQDDIRIATLDKPAREILAEYVPHFDNSSRELLYKEELGEVDRLLKELRDIKELSKKALDYNQKVLIKGGIDNEKINKEKNINPVYAEKISKIEKQFTTKYSDTIAFILHYSMCEFIPIHGLDLTQLQGKIKNNKIYFQACIDTAIEVTKILRLARARILSRIEEDKPAPDISSLIEQWKKDGQPGRAILWSSQHNKYVKNLPEPQKQSLKHFQDTFDDIIENLGELYKKRIALDNTLDGICGKAREYFLCNDSGGITRLIAGLQTHNDQDKALQFIPMLQGYLDEINGDTNSAIKNYQRIKDGPAHLDALTRQFALHTSDQPNWSEALETLKILSGISPIYSPMYADLLFANNNIDLAVEIYTEYMLENPDDLDTMMKLGKVFLECGSVEGVQWTMNYILGKTPENQTAIRILEEINKTASTDSVPP